MSRAAAVAYSATTALGYARSIVPAYPSIAAGTITYSVVLLGQYFENLKRKLEILIKLY